MSTTTSPTEFPISAASLNLFSQYSGITNESELRDHIITIHQKATKVSDKQKKTIFSSIILFHLKVPNGSDHPVKFVNGLVTFGVLVPPLTECHQNQTSSYRCIRKFRFIDLRAKTHPFYETAVSDFLSQISATQQQPRLCDLGCAMGTDLRQFVMDGVPGSLATGIDISPELISIGFELFREDPKSQRHPISWVIADVLSDDSSSTVQSGDNSSSTVLSGGDGGHHKNILNPLSHYHNYFYLIYTGAVIHLFPQDTVKKFLVNAIQMLSPHGTIFGRNMGARDHPFVLNRHGIDPSMGSSLRYLHTKDSIKELLEELGLIKVETWAHEDTENRNEDDDSEQRKNMVVLFWKGVKPGK